MVLNNLCLGMKIVDRTSRVVEFMNDTKSGASFIDWLAQNYQAIKDGGAVFDGERVTLDSTVTQYECCYSVIFFTSKNRSPFLLMGSSQQKRTAVIYTILTLLFGWWGIPWGFLWPPAIIASNICGGLKLTVGQLIAFVENPDGSPLPESGIGRNLLMWFGGVVGSCLLFSGISHVIALFAIAGNR